MVLVSSAVAVDDLHFVFSLDSSCGLTSSEDVMTLDHMHDSLVVVVVVEQEQEQHVPFFLPGDYSSLS